MIKITCYGPRGSLPTPSRFNFSTVEFGGNTNCYYVEAGPFKIILDNGSGVAVLGNDLMAKGLIGTHFINLITHYHWDHIQGLPFCVPYFIGSNTFHIHGPIPSGHEKTGEPRSAVEKMLSAQQANPHFPVAHECLPAQKLYTGHDRQFSSSVYYGYFSPNIARNDGVYRQVSQTGYENLPKDERIKITTIPLNHPDGCLGYRIDYMGDSIAYCTDNEPFRFPNHQINTLAKDVDWLLMDGQYTEDQLAGMVQTFGHGSPNSCIDQAVACNAKYLAVHHHHIIHDDEKLELMEAEAKKYATSKGFDPYRLNFARESMVWTLDNHKLDVERL